MKTSKLVALAVALAALQTFAAPAPAAAKPPSQPSADEQFGGILTKPAEGVVRYYDYQSKIAGKDMLGFFLAANSPIRLHFEHRRMEGRFDLARAAEIRGDANVAIFMVDDPSLPMSLLALEDRWAVVNVAKISSDNPKLLTLLRRAEKLVTRVGTGLLGGHFCLQIAFSAMQPVYSLEELDRMEGRAIAPSSLTQISYSLQKLGLAQARPCTYEQACVEGWAPAPTNDVQREIWNDVKNPANRFRKDLPELKK